MALSWNGSLFPELFPWSLLLQDSELDSSGSSGLLNVSKNGLLGFDPFLSKKAGAPKFWCPFKRPSVFCFNLKTGHQKHEFLLFAKCLYVFHTKPGYIRTLPAWNDHALIRKHSKKSWGHQSSGARAPKLWCPQLYLECFLTNACSFHAGNVLI